MPTPVLVILRQKLVTLITKPDAVLRRLKYRAYTRPLRRADNRRGRYALQRHGLLPILAERADGAFPPHWGDLWYLYREIRRRRPRAVLEFGCGFSTLVIARALADNRRDHGDEGIFCSVDCSEEWANAARAALPGDLAPFCRITHSPLVTEERHGRRVFRHDVLPDISPDFVYLDGPEFPEGLPRGDHIAADLLAIEPRLPARFFGIIDGREQNVRFLGAHLTGEYTITIRNVLARHSIER